MADIGYVVFSDSSTQYYSTFNAGVTAALTDPGAVFYVTESQSAGSYAKGATVVFLGGATGNILGGGSNVASNGTNITLSAGTYTSTAVIAGGYGNSGSAGSLSCTVTGTAVITKSLYAGGWGAGIHDTTSTVTISGGTVNTLYASTYQGALDESHIYMIDGFISMYHATGATNGNVGHAILTVSGGSVGTLYAGARSPNSVIPLSTVIIEGGTIGSIYGGNYYPDNEINYVAELVKSEITVRGGVVRYDVFLGGSIGAKATDHSKVDAVAFRLEGNGYLAGNLYGGNNTCATHLGDATITLAGGTVKGNIFGTGKVADFTQGNVTINIDGYDGGTEWVFGSHTSNANKVTYNVSDGVIDLLNGGSGQNTGSSSWSEVTYNEGVEINVTGGTVLRLNGAGFYANALHFNDAHGAVVINISGGSIGGVSGKSALAGVSQSNADSHLYGDVAITISGDATVGNATTKCHVEGVGCGTAHGDVAVEIAGGIVYGNVYGISSHANVAATGSAAVTISGGSVTGEVHGFGLGTAATGGSLLISGGQIDGKVYATGSAAYTGNTSVTISGGVLNSYTYAGGAAAITGNTYLTMSDGTVASGKRIYGGNNAGDITGDTHIAINGGTFSNGFVFGGSDSGTTITGDTYITVLGGNGGFNANGGAYGVITGTTHVMVERGGQVQAILGGGYNAVGCDVGFTDIIVRGKATNYVAGGGFRGAVVGDAENAASTRIRIEGGTVLGSQLYGGGYYATALVGTAATSGSTSIEIGAGTASDAYVHGTVYGGGRAGSVYGTTAISLTSGTVGGNIYGACMSHSASSTASDNGIGHVYGDTAISISGGTVKGNVFGGGELGSNLSGTATINITGGKFASTSRVFGGGALTVAGSSAGAYNQASSVTLDSGTTTVQRLAGGARVSAALTGGYTLTGDTSVTLSAGTVSQAVVGRANVYGGATVTDGGANTVSTIDISGGQAYIVAGAGLVTAASTTYTYNGNVEISVSGGQIDYLFGGNVGSKKEFCAGTTMNGNVSITVDTSVNTVSLGCLYAGSNSSTGYEATHNGNTLVTFTGLGSNLIWAENAVGEKNVCGVSGDGSGKLGDINRGLETPQYTRTLCFDDFTGVFNAPVISRFDTIAFDDSAVTFGSALLKLGGVKTWNFSLDSSLVWNDGVNSFAGDDLVFGTADDTVSTNWEVMTSNNNKVFAGWDQANITLFGVALDTYNDSTGTWSAEGFGYVATWDDEDHKIIIAQA